MSDDRSSSLLRPSLQLPEHARLLQRSLLLHRRRLGAARVERRCGIFGGGQQLRQPQLLGMPLGCGCGLAGHC